MKNKLYVANLSHEITEEKLREVFGQFGEVTSVHVGNDAMSKRKYALVEMAVEKTATKAMNELNGQKLDDLYLSISYPDVDLNRELLPKQRKMVEEMAAQLEETEKVPLRQLELFVRLTSVSLAQALLKETLEIEAAGGLMTNDGQRRRSKGGVFFYMARPRVSSPIRHLVFTRKGKLPAPKEVPAQDVNSAAASTS